jgi:hypothetical protein
LRHDAHTVINEHGPHTVIMVLRIVWHLRQDAHTVITVLMKEHGAHCPEYAINTVVFLDHTDVVVLTSHSDFVLLWH